MPRRTPYVYVGRLEKTTTKAARTVDAAAVYDQLTPEDRETLRSVFRLARDRSYWLGSSKHWHRELQRLRVRLGLAPDPPHWER